MGIAENIYRLRSELPAHVKLVAVSKTQPEDSILEAYTAGQRSFGENKVQELVRKSKVLPADIEWHLIGHLQTNKVKQLVSVVTMIESVDSLKLLEEIDRQAGRMGRVVSCLLQFHIAREETKFGLSLEEAESLLNAPSFRNLQNVRLKGVMGMASFVDDDSIVRREFRELRQIFQELKSRFFPNDPEFKEVSMGMTGDYKLAVEEGSTMIRIGTKIFGDRHYS